MTIKPYNPLDKISLARSIEGEVLAREASSLSALPDIKGAGIYLIYYTGTFPAYRPIASANRNGDLNIPIYVGKAIPKGGRKGGLTKDASKGKALLERLRQHAASIEDVTSLELEDFYVRHLVVEDIWIPLGENILIESFKPLWNRAIDGFGNKDPGRRRKTQYKSPWDVLHPGRRFAEKLADSGLTTDFLLQRVDDYLAARPLARLPKKIAEQQAEDEADAEEAADEA